MESRAASQVSLAADSKYVLPTTPVSITPSGIDEKKPDAKKQEPLHRKKFKYLSEFTEPELLDLQKKFGKPLNVLDQQIDDYWTLYWAERLKKYGAISTNFLYMFFRAMTSNAGISNVANIVSPDSTVSESVGYGLGVTFAVPGTLIYVFTSSAKKDAIHSILDYVNRPPLNEFIVQTLKEACENKTEALLSSLKLCVTSTVNATAAASCIIPIIEQLNTLSPALKWSIIAGVGYLGFHYNGMCYDEAVTQGISFWKDEKRTSLLEEIKKGNIAIPFEILLQGMISAAGLRAFPNYFFAAVKAGTGLGFFLPATLVAILTAIHGLCALYPVTFNHYLNDLEKLRIHISKSIDPQLVERLLDEQLHNLKTTNLSVESKQTYRKKIIDGIVEETIRMMSAEATKNKGCFSLFKENPTTILPTGMTAAIGGYFGSQVIAPALASAVGGPPALITTLCATAGAALFGGIFYKAEDNRALYKLLTDKVILDEKKAEGIPLPAKPSDTVAEILATFFALFNAISSATSTMGSNKLLGGNTPAANTAVTTAAVKSGLNSIEFFQPKVAKTLKSSLRCSNESEVTPLPPGFSADDIELQDFKVTYPPCPL